MKSTIAIKNFNSIPVLVPNTVKDFDNYYISYNNYDTGIYGCDTTALVLGNMEKFLILNGDHRKAYDELSKNGLDSCLQYFKDNADKISKYSDRLE